MPPFLVLISHGMAGAERCFFGTPVLCSLFISRGRAGVYVPPLFGDVILCERIGCLQNYTLRKPAIFPARGSSKPLPYGVETDFCDKIIFPDKSVFCALFAIFAKNKRTCRVKVASSLLRFLLRKRTG